MLEPSFVGVTQAAITSIFKQERILRKQRRKTHRHFAISAEHKNLAIQNCLAQICGLGRKVCSCKPLLFVAVYSLHTCEPATFSKAEHENHYKSFLSSARSDRCISYAQTFQKPEKSTWPSAGII